MKLKYFVLGIISCLTTLANANGVKPGVLGSGNMLSSTLSHSIVDDKPFDITLPYTSSSKKKKVLKLLNSMVVETKQIRIPNFPNAFNPSIIPDGNGYLMTFRITPDKRNPWVSYIGIVRLDKSFNLASDIQVLNPRIGILKESPSQAEDARIFSYKNELYLIYNDNDRVTNPSNNERRDMYLAKLIKHGSTYHVDTPLKLMHEDKYETILWQKNWTPFVWNDNLMISYTYKPHEVLLVDMETGICSPCYEAPNPTKWSYGELRGGTPALFIDGEYLTFFHSSIKTRSKESKYELMHHYYMGAMTFKAEPPFEVTKMTPAPIVGKYFYTISDFHKRVIFPGGFIVDDNKIYVVYGKDDSEIWVATVNRDALKQTLFPPNYSIK